MNQESLRSRLLIELDCVTLDARAVAGGLQPPALRWAPPGGGWSIGQALEHLVAANESYLKRMRGLIYARDAAHSLDGAADWEPSLMGWLLVSGMRSKRKMAAPDLWRPEGEPRANVLELFLETQNTIITFLRASAALDWAKVRFSSPANRVIRINLGDAFSVMTVHAQRHVKQMERVRDLAGFPG